MFFKNMKSKKSAQSSAESKKSIENMTNEITKIWSGENKREHTDVGGSYTGNPVGFDIPEQDGDDL